MTILSHDAQVIIPTLIAAANQLGVKHLAVKLLFCRFIDVFERSNHPRFPQSKHRVGILYLGCRRSPAARRGCTTATGSTAFPVTAGVPVPAAVPAAISAAAIPTAVATAMPAAVATATPATPAAVASAIAITGESRRTESSENGFAGE
jgi:hypothetical protein